MWGYGPGFRQAKEAGAAVAWGARAILERNGSFGLLWDRQSWVDLSGEQYTRFTGDTHVIQEVSNHLNSGPLREANKVCAEMVKEGRIKEDEPNEVILYDKHGTKVIGNTNASFGYLYLAAWVIVQ